jgi:hypothetical protein
MKFIKELRVRLANWIMPKEEVSLEEEAAELVNDLNSVWKQLPKKYSLWINWRDFDSPRLLLVENSFDKKIVAGDE